jgi:hypothetical protein
MILTGMFTGSCTLFAQDLLCINEFMASNMHAVLAPDKSGFPDWIEIYNGESSAVDMEGLFLTDDLSDPFKWQVPAGSVIEAGSYYLIWADGLNTKDHASFKLSGEGEQIGLFYPDGRIIDSLTFASQVTDLSFGRTPDGGSEWVYFPESTSGSMNDVTGSTMSLQYDAPDFSKEGGLHDNPFYLNLQAEGENEIYYTTDGTVPTRNSDLYTSQIMVEKSMVVRARVYGEDLLPSKIRTQSYILDEHSNLPVISIACPPEYLFDETVGITPGICVQDELGSPPPFDPNANFWNDWERSVHLEYYSPDGYRGLNQDAGIAIFGGYFGRQIRQKSFTLYARDQYGDTDFDFPLFPSKQVNSYKRFLLRCSSNDYIRTFIRDAMMNTLVIDQMDLDYWGYHPAMVYINGAFWGLYNVREKMNQHYPESNYGIESDSVELVEWRDGYVQGDTVKFMNMVNFARENDLSLSQNYDHLKSLMDIREFMNYFITEIYVCNHDWLHQNIKCWREAGEQGRWRWLLYDLDWGFNGMDPFGADQAPVNTFQWILDRDGEVSDLFNRLIQNNSFKSEFAQRFVTQINLTFRPERVHHIIDSLAEQIGPEMPRQINRWNAIKSMEYWDDQLAQLHQFAIDRPGYILSQLNETLIQEDKVQLTLEVSDPEAGRIKVFDTPVTDPVYTGEWYKNIALQIKAQSYHGWHFVRWEGSISTEDDSISLTLGTPSHLVAVFERHELPAVVISEIHYNPSSELQGTDDDFEFVELVNAGQDRIDLSGFRFSEGIQFTFNQGTYMDPGEIVLLAKNTATYAGTGVHVYQVAEGKLDNAGEKLILRNHLDQIVDLVHYDDHYPWPREADGQGPSLELINARLDNNLAASWRASSEIGGTPGTGVYTGTARAIKDPSGPLTLSVSPNPFYDQIRVTFSLPETCLVLCRVYNAYAQEVAVLINEMRLPGEHSIDWEPADLPSGFYFIHVTAGSSTRSEPVIYVGKQAY